MAFPWDTEDIISSSSKLFSMQKLLKLYAIWGVLLLFEKKTHTHIHNETCHLWFYVYPVFLNALKEFLDVCHMLFSKITA